MAHLKINTSPVFWFVLGTLWCIAAVVMALTKDLSSIVPLIPLVIAALFCYFCGCFLLFRRRNPKT
jgi:hypothetical protein